MYCISLTVCRKVIHTYLRFSCKRRFSTIYTVNPIMISVSFELRSIFKVEDLFLCYFFQSLSHWPTCFHCSQSIVKGEKRARAKGNSYHAECLKCAICGRQLNKDTGFYELEPGKLVCEDEVDVSPKILLLLLDLVPFWFAGLAQHNF